MTEPLDMTQLAQDDALLDALGRGEPASGDDDLASLLATWRDDLFDGAPAQAPRPAAPITPLAPAIAPLVPSIGAARVRRGARRGRTLAVAAAAVVIGLSGGTTAAAFNAGPDSPLWPITRVVFADRADSRLAEQRAEESIARARDAIGQARYADAAKLLDEATASAGQVTDDGVVQRLLDEISAVRGLLPGAASGTGSGGAGTGAGAGGSGTGGAGGGTGAGATPAPTGSSGGGILPPLPLPVPTVSVCLPLLCPSR